MDSKRLIIVTGLSGAGKSTALKALEDCGFETMDNLPLKVVPDAVRLTAEGVDVAVGVDARTRGFNADNLDALMASLSADPDWHVTLLFVDADRDSLYQRFSETRRKHPLAMDGPIDQGLDLEIDRISDIRLRADWVIDTSSMRIADTRAIVKERFGTRSSGMLNVTVMSFGFSKGLPRSADLVFDVRFLRNPHYELHLKPLTGQHADVADYVRTDEGFDQFLDHVSGLLAMLLPRYQAEGKSYLTIAFGCTGGKHRSVMMAETIASLIEKSGVRVAVRHRDMPGQG